MSESGTHKSDRNVIKFLCGLVIGITLTLGFCRPASAQSLTIGFGANGTRSTSVDPDPNVRKDGGSYIGGLYGEIGVGLPKGFSVGALGEYNTSPLFSTLYTRDEALRKADYELRLRPELKFKPAGPLFIAGGFDISRHSFDDGSSQTSYNPRFTVGAEVKSHTVTFTRIFQTVNPLEDTDYEHDYGQEYHSEFSGYQLGYTYRRPLFSVFSLKIGGEGTYARFREGGPTGIPTNIQFDRYLERDATIVGRIGFEIGGKK